MIHADLFALGWEHIVDVVAVSMIAFGTWVYTRRARRSNAARRKRKQQ